MEFVLDRWPCNRYFSTVSFPLAIIIPPVVHTHVTCAVVITTTLLLGFGTIDPFHTAA